MRHRWLVFTLLALPTCLLAQTITASTSTIQAVTVFLDRAEVTRQVSIELPAGSHTVLVPGLPARLLVDSLRVRGEGGARLRLGSVETRRVYSTELTQQKEQQLTLALQALQDEKAALEGRRQALDTQAAFIERLAQNPTGKDKDAQPPLLAPEKWPAAWQAIGNGMAETNKARHALMQQLREVEVKIRKTEQELNQIRSGRRDSISALVNLETDRAQAVQLTLSYQVPGASWSPVYDAQLHTEHSRLELAQAAYVRQHTGEPWENVRLSVSTARPSAGAAMPELNTWWLDFPRPVLLERAKREMKAADEALASAVMAPAAQEAEETVAQVAGTEFAVGYNIAGKVSVGSDNSPQRFLLSRQELPVRLSARTTPRLDPRAFVYAEFDYEATAPLLPGNWRLVRDGQYVGEVTQAALRPGARMALAFGNDDAIEVNYQVMKNERGERGVFSKDQRVERRYRIEVTNRHRSPLPVSVYDQLPVARDEQIKVSLAPDTTPVTERDPGGHVGVLLWRQELKPQGKHTILFGYDVSYPQGRELPGF